MGLHRAKFPCAFQDTPKAKSQLLIPIGCQVVDPMLGSLLQRPTGSRIDLAFTRGPANNTYTSLAVTSHQGWSVSQLTKIGDGGARGESSSLHPSVAY
jgi:hypothetical protein